MMFVRETEEIVDAIIKTQTLSGRDIDKHQKQKQQIGEENWMFMNDCVALLAGFRLHLVPRENYEATDLGV